MHDDQLLVAVRHLDRERGPGQHGRMGLLGRLLDVLRIVIPTADDDHVLHAAGDKQLAVAEEAQVARPQEPALAAGHRRTEHLLGFLRLIPITAASRDGP